MFSEGSESYMHFPNSPAVLRRMRWLARGAQILYTTSLIVAFGYWWYVWQMHDGMPPMDEALGRWARANSWAFEYSSYPVIMQLSWPLFWWLTRRLPWNGAWSVLRRGHAGLVALIFLVLLILLLATPDVSEFRS